MFIYLYIRVSMSLGENPYQNGTGIQLKWCS